MNTFVFRFRSNEFNLKSLNWHYGSINSGNGLASNRQQTITEIIDNPV